MIIIKLTGNPLKKKAKRIICIIVAVLLAAIGYIVYKIKHEDWKLLADGIRADASVLAKHKGSTRKNKPYTMDVALLIKEGNKTFLSADTTAEGAIDNYQSVTININSDSYYKLKPGDKIKVVYLKDAPAKVKLLSEIE